MHKRYYHQGFALPTVLIASVVMLSMLLLSLQIISASSGALREQYYQQVAREAAEAGSARARECLSQVGSAAWTDSSPLRPHSDCSGTSAACAPNGNCYVQNAEGVRSSFYVGAATTGVEGRVSYSARGVVELLRPDGSVRKTVSQSIGYAAAYSILPKLSGGAGWATSDHLAVIASTDNKLYGFGGNGAAQITDSRSPNPVVTPIQTPMPHGVSFAKKVMTSGQGASLVCIIGSDDNLYCRGQGLDVGIMLWTKMAIPVGLKVFDLSVNGYGQDNVCALAGTSLSDTQAYCSGWGGRGQFATGSTITSVPLSAPVRFGLPSGMYAKKVHTHNALTCVITNLDDLYCAGRSDYGQIAGTVNGYVSNATKYNIPNMGGVARKAKDVLMQYHGNERNLFVLATDGTIWVSGARYTAYGGNNNTTGNTGTGSPDLWGNAPYASGVQWATGEDIRAAGSTGQCIGNAAGTLANGNPVVMWSCTNNHDQRWMYTAGTQAIWLTGIGGSGTNFCLDLPDNNTTNGTKISIYTCNGTAAQRWILESNGYIRNAVATNKCISLPGGSASNSARLEIWDCGIDSSQRFVFGARMQPWQDMIALNTALCGVRSDSFSGVWCSGNNSYGQMANRGDLLGGGAHGGHCASPSAGGAINMNMPSGVKIDISKLSSEWRYQYDALQVIGTDGNVYGGGRNVYGKLGHGSLGDSANNFRQCNTVKYQLPSGVTAVDMSTRDEFSTYVLGSDSNVYASGLNNQGQLGDGSTTNRLSPVKVRVPRAGIIY